MTETETDERKISEDLDFLDMSEYKVVYIIYVGKDIDDKNIYQFILSNNPDDVFSEGWGEKPASNIPKSILMIDEDMYEYVKELKTDMVLDLAQDNSCFSMQDARDNIVALAYENIDNYEEYPEEGRIVIHFGESIDEVEKKLAKRNLFLKFI